MSAIAAACGSSPTAPTLPSVPPTTYALNGIVSAAAPGPAIAGAQVRVLDVTGGGPAITNALGAFTVAPLAAGRHLVEVSKAGYQVSEAEITIVDRDVTISVTLVSAGT